MTEELRDIRVAAVQMQCSQGEKERNLRKIARWSKKAKERGADLVCFPELSVSGIYAIDTNKRSGNSVVPGMTQKVGESVPGGESVEALQGLAKELDISVCAGLIEKENSIIYNAYVILGPKGFVGKYRKTHMPAVEYPFYRFGSSFPIFSMDKCRIGIATCFDNTFPEVPRILALKGAEVILMPNAWSEKDPFEPGDPANYEDRRKAVLTYVPSRAFDNGVYVVHLDQVGSASRGLRFPGFSVILGPDGQALAETQGSREEMIVADLKSSTFEGVRSRPDFGLRARRPEIYDGLTDA